MTKREGVLTAYYHCLICDRSDVAEINQQLAQGIAITTVAVEFGLAHRTLRTHWLEHVMTGVDEAGVTLITLRDVLDIPLQMRERNQLIKALIMRTLEPLMRQGKYSGINHVQLGFLTRLLRIQQADEQTILRIAGVLRDDGQAMLGAGDSYRSIRETIDARILELAEGDDEAATQARLLLADMLLPMEDLPGGTEAYSGIQGTSEEDLA